MIRRLRPIFWVVLIGAAIFGWNDTRDSYSCQECRARKEVQTHSLLWWNYRRRSGLTFPGDPKLIHQHDWWRYSHYDSLGLGGCLRRGVACSNHRYRDDTD
jgi:hypothetical protein